MTKPYDQNTITPVKENLIQNCFRINSVIIFSPMVNGRSFFVLWSIANARLQADERRRFRLFEREFQMSSQRLLRHERENVGLRLP